MPSCPGCGREFHGSGYMQHLQRTRWPHCAAIYEQIQNYIPGLYEELKAAEEREAAEGLEGVGVERAADGQDKLRGEGLGIPRQFSGDFFGNDYGPDDFEELDDWDEDDAEPDSGQSDSDMANEFEEEERRIK